jgi:hypothetical protein
MIDNLAQCWAPSMLAGLSFYQIWMNLHLLILLPRSGQMIWHANGDVRPALIALEQGET